MTSVELAAERLIFHTTPEPGSFLEMLRPFRGVSSAVLDDVESALRTVAARLGEDQLPRSLVSALWALVHLGRAWAIEPHGMLRRNDLLSDADMETLAQFLDRVGYAVMCLLDQNPEEAFADWPGA